MILESHLQLVHRLSRKFQRRFPQHSDDILGTAMLALVVAHRKAEEKKLTGDDEIRYLVVWIQGSIKQYLAKCQKCRAGHLHDCQGDYAQSEPDLEIKLTPIQQQVLQMRVNGCKLKEIASKFNKTKQWVHYILKTIPADLPDRRSNRPFAVEFSDTKARASARSLCIF